MCSFQTINARGLQEHYKKYHNVFRPYKQQINFSNIKIYCIFCHEELKYSHNLFKINNVYRCMNDKCNNYLINKIRIGNSISKGKINSTNTDKKYHEGALKRELNFKNTLLKNDMTKKQYIISKNKKKQSLTMKRKILNGEFTPCVTNSWCQSRCYIDNIPFRSTWEAYFYLYNKYKYNLNILLKYEKIRILYKDETNKDRIYITDFSFENIIYEIKPETLFESKNNILKKQAAIKYCSENNLIYKIISEDWFKINYKQELLDLVSNLKTKQKMEKNLKQFI